MIVYSFQPIIDIHESVVKCDSINFQRAFNVKELFVSEFIRYKIKDQKNNALKK